MNGQIHSIKDLLIQNSIKEYVKMKFMMDLKFKDCMQQLKKRMIKVKSYHQEQLQELLYL